MNLATSSSSFVDVIRAKRDGKEISDDDIIMFVNGATAGTIPSYQLSALLMAICIRGLSLRETVTLTKAMAMSGPLLKIRLFECSGRTVRVDKHSTGGVGDKVTMILAPIVACFPSLAIAKLSGRALGFTGGTVDKLESLPGYRVSLSEAEIEKQINSIGVSVSAATSSLAPADHVLYELRDVTGTVESQYLICASVLSKKIAAGADIILLDVKYGSGAFMKDFKSARELAVLMLRVAQLMGVRVSVVLSDMNEPLGRNIGNALEIEECISALQNKGPADLMFVCIELASVLLLDAKICATFDEARSLVREKLQSGEALRKFEAWVAAQGGDLQAFAKRRAPVIISVRSPCFGTIASIDAEKVSRIVFNLGSGRTSLGQNIDPLVGICLLRKHGERVQQGDIIANIHASTADSAELAGHELIQAFQIVQDSHSVPRCHLIREIIRADRASL